MWSPRETTLCSWSAAAAVYKREELLRGIRWSSATVEQGHRSASIIGQFHMTMGSDMLMKGSYFHMMKPFVTAEKPRKSVVVALKRIERLEHRRPGHTNGRHIFLKTLFDEAMSALTPGARLSVAARTEIMKQHSRLFRELLPVERSGMEHRARLA